MLKTNNIIMYSWLYTVTGYQIVLDNCFSLIESFELKSLIIQALTESPQSKAL